MISPPRRWTVAPRLSPERLTSIPGVHPLVVQILHNRGIREASEVESFLAGPDGWTGDPYTMKGVPEAVERLIRAIEARELVAVHGDFDADGLTATALLTEAFAALGARVVPFVPQREDGYGLNVKSLEALASRGVKLTVTVDCGISSPAEVAAAHEMGMDVVVTDHHRVTGALPGAVAVVDPRQPDCQYPFKALAGVGVAYKLAQALFARQMAATGRSFGDLERSLLDLVALGTVTDVVPLLGENRVLAIRGLAVLNQTTRPGLRELIRTSGLRPGEIDSWDISYALGPRLNAAGRLGDASASYRLLVGSADQAAELALALEDANRERQQVTEEMVARARQEVLGQLPGARLLLVAGPEYPHGILGLVAGRLSEEFARPVVVLGLDGEEARGSARSIPEFDLTAALRECRDLLVRFGGHARAAGFTVLRSKLEALRRRLVELAEEALADRDLDPTLPVDAELSLRKADLGLHREVQRLAPFGYENPAPLFLTRGLRVLEARTVGQYPPGHLRLTVHDGSRRWGAIAFGYGALASDLPPFVDLAYHLELDTWGGSSALRLRIRGLRPARGLVTGG